MKTHNKPTKPTKSAATLKPKPTIHKQTHKKVFTVIHCTEHQITFREYKNTKTFKAFEDDIIFWGTANQAKAEIAKMISLTK